MPGDKVVQSAPINNLVEYAQLEQPRNQHNPLLLIN